MKKKILIMGDYPEDGETISGGIMRSVYLTANALKQIAPEYDIHVFSIPSSSWMKKYPILVPKFLYKLWALNKMKEINPDLIHANGTGWDYGYPASAWKKCPVLLTVHGISHNESKYWTVLKGAWHRITCNHIEHHILERARNIVVVSSYVEREIRRYVSETKHGDYIAHIDIISNPVDPCFFDVKKYVIPNRLLYVGGIEERKGLDVLIRALYIVKKHVPDVMLNVVGSIRSPVYCANAMKLISDLNLIDNVNFVGKINDTLLMKEYSNAEIYVSPSFEESEGITILEAMATGTPVIATRSGGAESIIKDNVNGLLVGRENSEKLAFKILVCGEVLREQLGKAGQMTALKYLPENIARQYMEVYTKLL